jgi:hypothetical protein
MDWHEDQQIRPTVGEWKAGGQWQEDLLLTEYIESRVLKWIKELEQMADLALQPQGDLPPPLTTASLPKFSSAC